MTSRYRVEYALKRHRRDEFIEWIKGLLAVPFVLHGDLQNTDVCTMAERAAAYEAELEARLAVVAKDCQHRYLEVFHDVESMIENHRYIEEINSCGSDSLVISRLQKLIPSIGSFYTSLPLARAFKLQDSRRSISRRRLVSPSFNDVRMVLCSAQIMALADIYHNDPENRLRLVTFDGDVTLYEDGQLLKNDDAIVDPLVDLLAADLYVAVVTAAGYPGQEGAEQYYGRLKGLVDTMKIDPRVSDAQRERLLIMGAESNYLFRYSNRLGTFQYLDGDDWYLPHMREWDPEKIEYIMDTVYQHMRRLQRTYNLAEDTTIIRKARSVGIIPNQGFRILRELLEEMVLSCNTKLNEILSCLINPRTATQGAREINGCAFNGGSDVWVDIGDKSLGVECLQHYLGRCESPETIFRKSQTLHLGDQFASVGANDFKARQSACTVWIASPRETTAILKDLVLELEVDKTKT